MSAGGYPATVPLSQFPDPPARSTIRPFDPDDPRHVLLTVEEAAAAAHVTPSTIRTWANRGLITPAAHNPVRYLEYDVLVAERDTRRPTRLRRLLEEAARALG